jgi:hypothetical protein
MLYPQYNRFSVIFIQKIFSNAESLTQKFANLKSKIFVDFLRISPENEYLSK